MPTVTVSASYRVVIPLDLRRQMNIKPGDVFEIVALDGAIALIPRHPVEAVNAGAGLTLKPENGKERDF